MRQWIVQQGASERLTFRAVAHALAKCLTQSLGNSPVHLSLQEFGIDDPPAVMHSHVAQDFEGTGVAVHFDDGHMRTEAKGVVTQDKMHGKLQAHLHVRWQLLAPLHCSNDFGKGEGMFWAALIQEFAVLKHNILGSAVQEMRGQESHFLTYLLEPFIHCRAAKRHAATRERTLP